MNRPAFEVIVYGQPAPQGSKAYKGQSKRGRAILVEQVKGVKPWRQDVSAAALRAIEEMYQHPLFSRGTDDVVTVYPTAPWTPLDGPLRAQMVFTLRKPASAPKRRRTWPCRTPDLSKLIRSTEDALTSAGVWADDARVVFYVDTGKVYPGEHPDALASPGCVIRIWTVTEENP